ncbi:MAG TPA: hypothetical protein V6C46_06625, partial [Coleofasciculaceae cyanobacterium]
MKWMEFKDRSPSRSVDEAHQFLNEMLWHLFPTNNDWVVNFSQSWEIREFQLGDQLNSGEEPGPDHSDHNRLHLLLLGHVRLISLDLLRQQEIPVALLEAGESWGADQWFCQQPLSYRAVGSSPGVVATLPIAQLEYWLQQVPQLQEYWQTEALARQQLIFFKAKTGLRSQT